MAIKPIPERLVNFNVYDNSERLLGVASVELPSIEAMSDTVSGAGLAGEIESPTIGHFSSMTIKFTWRSTTTDFIQLAAPIPHLLTVRGAMQVMNAAAGVQTTQAIKVVVRGVPKTIGLGSMEPSASMENESEFEVSYLKIWVEGKEQLEIDKYNYRFKVGGVDYMAKVRKDLGVI